MGDWIEIGLGALVAAINPLGAELSSLRDARGRELMTNADPAFWSGRAPLLFPIVGRAHDDRLLIDGTHYPMPKHGFARRQKFELIEQSPAHARFRLRDNEDTRACYPFAFVLDAGFAIEAEALVITISLTNPATTPLWASFGFHPAFAWPLPESGARDEHRILFAADEPAMLKRITPEGYATGPVRPSPVDGRSFTLADALFNDDALVWDPIVSHGLRYGVPHGPGLEIGWDAPRLGIWTKPGARFVCVEPWHGIADAEGFAGEFRDKPGVFTVDPGATWRTRMRIALATDFVMD